MFDFTSSLRRWRGCRVPKVLKTIIYEKKSKNENKNDSFLATEGSVF